MSRLRAMLVLLAFAGVTLPLMPVQRDCSARCLSIGRAATRQGLRAMKCWNG
jgi:hypothetical protein